jgi:hypothetical protein
MRLGCLQGRNRLEFTSDLEFQMQSRFRGQIRELSVQRQPGGWILRGQSRTFYAKQMAQHAVMQATDEPILANDIEVH